MTEAPIRIGVVGLGFGQHLAATLRLMPQFDLIAVADRSSHRPIESIAKTLRARAHRDAREMIEHERLDAVVLALPPHTRSELVEICVQRGISLFLEKPLAGTSHEARGLATICKAARAPVMMGFSFRYHAAIGRAKELLDTLGEPLLFSGHYVFNWSPAADGWLWDQSRGGGILNENSCHLLDVVRHLFGAPVSVNARGLAAPGSPGINAVSLQLGFDSGLSGTLVLGGVGTRAHKTSPGLEVFALNGRLALEGRDHMWTAVAHDLRDADQTHRFEQDPERIARTRYSDALEHFAACIVSGGNPSATIADGVWAVDMAEAAYASLRTSAPVLLTGNGGVR